MSHFTTLIIGDNPEEQLEPYCEQTEDPKYTEFIVEAEWAECWEEETLDVVNMPDGRRLLAWDEEFNVKSEDGFGYDSVIPEGLCKVAVPFKEYYPNYDTYMTEWHGVEKNDDNEYGYFKNPNAKWDWYVLGGRWSGFFTLKDGSKSDQALFKDIDFVKMDEERLLKGEKDWEASEKYIEDQKLKEEEVNGGTLYFQYGREKDATKETFMKGYAGLSVFSILKDSKWFEKGKMGWWACVSHEKDEIKWQDELSSVLVDTLPETMLSLYDCHI